MRAVPGLAFLLLLIFSFESRAQVFDGTSIDTKCDRVSAPGKFSLQVAHEGNLPVNSGIRPGGFVDLADGSPLVHGIDVSKYQDEADFQSVGECGGRFAYVRLSGGTNPDNELLYRTHWANVRASKILPGPYHNLSVLPLAAERLSKDSAKEIENEVESLRPIAISSAKIQTQLFLSRLDEVLALDPVTPGVDSSFLPIALDLTYRPIAEGTVEQKRAYGKLYDTMICTFLDGVRASKFGSSSVLLLVRLNDYADYGMANAPCDIDKALIWVRDRPSDGTPYYVSLPHSAYESICSNGYGDAHTGTIRSHSRCVMEQYTSFGGFALFEPNKPLNLDRFFGSESDLLQLAIKREGER